jgi:hypothetical protein
MTLPKYVQNSNQQGRLIGRRLTLTIIIVLVTGIMLGAWFFFISDLVNAIGKNDNYLPPNCYSINGKQICPPMS